MDLAEQERKLVSWLHSENCMVPESRRQVFWMDELVYALSMDALLMFIMGRAAKDRSESLPDPI
jgi:hypothetical protein